MKQSVPMFVTALAALLLASCTYVPTDGQPRVVNAHTVPFELLDRHNPTIPSIGHATYVVRTVWLISSHQQLVPVTRRVSLPGGLNDVVSNLLNGPTRLDLLHGFSSALPHRLVLVGATDSHNQLILEFRGVWNDGPRELLAVGQLVLTAGDVANQAVSLRINGMEKLLPLPHRTPALVVTPLDYAPLTVR